MGTTRGEREGEGERTTDAEEDFGHLVRIPRARQRWSGNVAVIVLAVPFGKLVDIMVMKSDVDGGWHRMLSLAQMNGGTKENAPASSGAGNICSSLECRDGLLLFPTVVL